MKDDEWNMEIPKIRSRYLSMEIYEKGFSKETCKSKYTMHPESDRIYHDVKEVYRWIRTKRDITGVHKLNIINLKISATTGDYQYGSGK